MHTYRDTFTLYIHRTYVHTFILFSSLLFLSFSIFPSIFALCPYHFRLLNLYSLVSGHIQAYSNSYTYISRAEWPCAITIVRLAEACTNELCYQRNRVIESFRDLSKGRFFFFFFFLFFSLMHLKAQYM